MKSRHVTDSKKEPVATVTYWQWPAHGGVINLFSANNRGINISGHLNDPIYASASGLVVYSGNNLRGYGNLLIIRHNGEFLTTYAHNNKLLVKAGDKVRIGQKIAKMGNTDSERTMLHFEVRRDGQPVNPLKYLVSS